MQSSKSAAKAVAAATTLADEEAPARPVPTGCSGVSVKQELFQALKGRDLECRSKHEPLMFTPEIAQIDVCGWVKSVFSPHGRHLTAVAAPASLVLLVAIVVAIGTQTELMGGHWDLSLPSRFQDMHAGLFVSVSFLMAFRLNRAATRYYEARQASGLMIVACRELASEACAYLAHDPASCEALCRWVVAFPVATRNYLREESGLASVAELKGVLEEKDLLALADAQRQPLLCIDFIRQAALAGTRSNQKDSPFVAAEGLRAMNMETESLHRGMGSMERINNSPLPFCYVAHLRTFLLLYLLAMPIVMGESLGWLLPAVMAILAYAFLGIEATAMACERPFGYDPNHLTLDRFCDVVVEDVLQSLQQSVELRREASGKDVLTSLTV
mmetsp:Transcript_32020/g.75060  ORF Transcript_32020/g.75060 Transcript_32020/m.75060 type:complete len:386 (+) Transcript_32020:81-1238(+)